MHCGAGFSTGPSGLMLNPRSMHKAQVSNSSRVCPLFLGGDMLKATPCQTKGVTVGLDFRTSIWGNFMNYFL